LATLIQTPVSATQDGPLPTGLTSDEARSRIAKFGPNAVADTSLHPLRRALREFWTPVPWMLEAAIVLEIVLGKYIEAGFPDLRSHYGLRQDSSLQPPQDRVMSPAMLTLAGQVTTPGHDLQALAMPPRVLVRSGA
jgi:hypothetical protein